MGLVTTACVFSVISARGLQKPTPEEAPLYRQKGNSKAPIIMVEYSDFQCPACKIAEKPVKDILSLYGHDLRFVFKHFPLEHTHPLALAAALASECAGRQGKFWPFHGRLYEDQEGWSKSPSPSEAFRKYALELGLDEASFKICLDDPSALTPIRSDLKEGSNRWVASTPTFFINGRRFVGSRQLSLRGTIWIDRILKP
jgi:protein-disulfide isomerase